MSHQYHSKSEKKWFYRKTGIAAAVFAVAFAAIVILPGQADNRGVVRDTDTVAAKEPDPNRIELNCRQYIPKTNIETYLFMGIDSYDTVHEVKEYDGTGQCDFLQVLVRDLSAGTVQTLSIDRNTMTDVKSIDTDGTYLATTKLQLALSHAKGDGMEMSCENTVDAVSNFLYGQKIDGYASLNMGAIPLVNHLAGGVTVTIEDDFSEVDPSLVKGETVKLDDDQAFNFVHARWYVGDEENESRMRRQTVYLDALKPMIREKFMEDAAFPLTLYESLEAYMVTNITEQKFSKIALLLAKEQDVGSLKIEGESAEGDSGFVEFEADQKSLEQVIAKLFYKECQ